MKSHIKKNAISMCGSLYMNKLQLMTTMTIVLYEAIRQGFVQQVALWDLSWYNGGYALRTTRITEREREGERDRE